MYWISVTTLGALAFFFFKGRKKRELEERDASSPDSSSAAGGTTGKVEEETAAAEPEDKAATPPGETDPAGKDPKELKALLKSEQDPYTRHLLYEKITEIAYKDRRKNKKMSDLMLNTGDEYVKEFESLKGSVFKKMGDKPKQVIIFKQLAIALEEAKKFKQAVHICEKAIRFGLDDGTKTGYTGRIERITKKMK